MTGVFTRRIEAAGARFIRRRTPTRPLPLTIDRRRLYILPTRSGAIFAALLVVMLLGATNYSNSLGFALTFWLAAIALVSMHHAHRNLLGLMLTRITAAPVFAGDHARFTITLDNTARRARRGVRISAPGIDGGEDRAAVIAPGGRVDLQLSVPTARRGRLACPRLRVETVVPLGLFRAWSWLAPSAHTLVYPQPTGAGPRPEPADDGDASTPTPARDSEEFLGHRPYIRGDSLRAIDWKASARTDGLLVHEHTRRSANTLWLDYEHAGTRDPEARLSQLARWVLDAERDGLAYGLRLPGATLAPDAGRGHREACLRALAQL